MFTYPVVCGAKATASLGTRAKLCKRAAPLALFCVSALLPFVVCIQEEQGWGIRDAICSICPAGATNRHAVQLAVLLHLFLLPLRNARMKKRCLRIGRAEVFLLSSPSLPTPPLSPQEKRILKGDVRLRHRSRNVNVK